MRTRLVASLLVTTVIAVQSQAAMMAYLTIKGQKTGVFLGGVTQKGREGKIAVVAADHDIIIPRDAATGLASGRKLNRPLKLTLELDKAAPLIYNALATNESLPEVKVEFWTPQNRAIAGVGTEVQHFTIKLTNASISEVHFNMHSILSPDTVKMPETIDVSFTYQKIEWTWNEGGITASDNWGG
jgi:type VI secretion system secreted protein Hcp